MGKRLAYIPVEIGLYQTFKAAVDAQRKTQKEVVGGWISSFLAGEEKEAVKLEQPTSVAQSETKEQTPMADEKHESPCPTCALNAYKAQQSDRDAANYKADAEHYKAEAAQVTSATSQVKTLQDEVERLKVEVQTAGNLPSVKDFLTHCESGNCAQHAQEWAEVKKDMAAQFLEGLTPDIVQAKAQGMDLIPKKITIKGIDSLLGGQHGAA